MIDSTKMRRAITGRILTTFLCLAALAAVAGCGGNGGSGDQQTATEAAQAYVDAVNGHDYQAVCGFYSASFKQRLAIGANCPDFVKEQTSGTSGSLKLIGVDENGDRATAHLEATTGESTNAVIPLQLALEQQGGEWKITGLAGGR